MYYLSYILCLKFTLSNILNIAIYNILYEFTNADYNIKYCIKFHYHLKYLF